MTEKTEFHLNKVKIFFVSPVDYFLHQMLFLNRGLRCDDSVKNVVT